MMATFLDEDIRMRQGQYIQNHSQQEKSITKGMDRGRKGSGNPKTHFHENIIPKQARIDGDEFLAQF